MEDGPSPGGESEDRQQQRLQLVVGRKEEEGKKKKKKKRKRRKKKLEQRARALTVAVHGRPVRAALRRFLVNFYATAVRKRKKWKRKRTRPARCRSAPKTIS